MKETGSKSLVSVVIPCKDEEDCIDSFYDATIQITRDLKEEFEFIFIDDGSDDDTLEKIRELSFDKHNIRCISFSRNFGKEAALFAGLERAQGDFVVVMDADLQDPPSLIPQMLQIIKRKDVDCVATRRKDRKGEPLLKTVFSHLFYKIMNIVSDIEIVDGARDYRMMSRSMVDAIVADAEYNRFSKGLYQWVGFKTIWLEYENIERTHGKTKWSFWNLFKYALNGITSYSTVPLSISSIVGSTMSFVSFLFLVFIVIRALLFGDPVAGWPSLVCIIVFLGGLILLNLGIIGLYISKTYLETKHRPIYIVKEIF